MYRTRSGKLEVGTKSWLIPNDMLIPVETTQHTRDFIENKTIPDEDDFIVKNQKPPQEIKQYEDKSADKTKVIIYTQELVLVKWLQRQFKIRMFKMFVEIV